MDNPGSWARMLPIGVACLCMSSLPVLSGRAPSPARPARGVLQLASLVWPGAFTRDGDGSATLFTARAGRYLAEVRSSGFTVGTGHAPQDSASVQFRGAQADAGVSLRSPQHAPLTWIRAVDGRASARTDRRFAEADFADVYPGIAARYRSARGELEIDFLVAPHADPDRIVLAGSDASRMIADPATGDVLVTHAGAHFRLKRPAAYQIDGSRTIPVPVRFALGANGLRFELGAYDHDRTLVIDPLVATYSTFVGTNTDAMYDQVDSVASDAAGNVYLGGYTQFDLTLPTEQTEHGFPTTPTSLNPPNPSSPNNNCAYGCGYVLKLDPQMHVVYGALIYGLEVHALAVDGSGSAYATGHTLDGNNFPATAGAFSDDPAGQVFAFKLTPDGSAFVYDALFVGDDGKGIAVDAAGDAYIVGAVSTPSLPTTPTALKPAYQATGNTINNDGFLVKIDPTGSTLVYGTYLGGSGTDVANAVAVDAAGHAVVVGQTASSDFVGMAGTVDGASDAYLIEVATDGSSILQGRFIGGAGDDFATCLAADRSGGWLIGGATQSSDFPTTVNAPQRILLGQRNGWVMHVDGAMSTLYSTLFGGSAIDGVLGIATDAAADAYIAGVTFSSDMPTTPTGFQDVTSSASADPQAGLGSAEYAMPARPNREGYMAELSADGSRLLYSTYLGGYYTSPRDYDPITMTNAVAVSPGGSIFAAGSTEAASFPVTDHGLRTVMGGQADGFLVRFNAQSLAVTTGTFLPEALYGGPYSFQLAASGGMPPYTWALVGFALPDGLSLAASGLISGTTASNQTEQNGYQFTVKVTDSAGAFAYKSLIIEPAGAPICTPSGCTLPLSVGQAAVWPLPLLSRAAVSLVAIVTGRLPPGMAIDTQNATITGTPTTPGSYSVAINEQDTLGRSATFNWTINVTDSSTSSGSSSTGGSSGGGTSSGSSGAGGPSSNGASSGGGGGSLDFGSLIGLAVLVYLSRLRRARVMPEQ